LDDLNVGWLGVFIAPTTKLVVWVEAVCRMVHRTCPVRQPRHPNVRVPTVGALTLGPPRCPVAHRTCTLECPVRHDARARLLRILVRI
jgi:hypothetical protein